MPLTDTAIRSLKPTKKNRRFTDERGLYLEVSRSGGKWWRFKYRYCGKEKRLSLGVYPDVSLRDAREARDESRKLLANGIDPGEQRKATKRARVDSHSNTFEMVTREWYGKNSPRWSETYRTRLLSRFERIIFPFLGPRPIADINAPELLLVMQRIEKTALDTAHRALGDCGRVFRYAISSGRMLTDPTHGLKGALPPRQGGHFAATLDPKALGAILRAFDTYQGTLPVRCALKLQPLVWVRPGELRTAQWAGIDLDKAEWHYVIPKTGQGHIVPLSWQAVALLKELQPLTGRGKFVFPSARSNQRAMSDNALLAAMRRLDIAKEEQTGHGFRAIARTFLDEELRYRPDIIEHQLGHTVKDPNGRAYNRTQFLDERKAMMQAWADHLDNLKAAKRTMDTTAKEA